MQRAALALAGMCAVSTLGLTAQELLAPTQSLQAHVEFALGARPADCGVHEVTILGPRPRADDLRKSVACVVEHAARKASAWATIYGGGIDSDIATGLMVGADGVIRYFDFDSDHLSATDGRSPLSEQPCQRAGVVDATERGAYFVCEG